MELATVHSEQENALLVTAAAGNEVWIGGTDAASEDTWKWDSTGTPLWYTNWYTGEPNNEGGNENCLVFNYGTTGKWNDGWCWSKFKYVCQFPTPPQPPPVYTLMHGALSWSNAYTTCQRAGLRLASVHSAAENALLVTAAAGNKVWIGGTDAASEGTWKWSPSGTPLSYTNWNGGEPNNLGREDCLEFWASTGKWNDAPCTSAIHIRKYVCQTEPPLRSPSSPPSPPPPTYYATVSMDITISPAPVLDDAVEDDMVRIADAITAEFSLPDDVDITTVSLHETAPGVLRLIASTMSAYVLTPYLSRSSIDDRRAPRAPDGHQ